MLGKRLSYIKNINHSIATMLTLLKKVDVQKLLLILLLIPLISFADDLNPFTSDGCSAFPDGTLKQNELWLSCCVAHDLAYWQGGTHQERLDADLALQQCVEQVGEPEIARLMLAGVRVGGTPFLPTKFRWGYGWPYLSGDKLSNYKLRGYKALNAAEQQMIQRMLGGD